MPAEPPLIPIPEYLPDAPRPVTRLVSLSGLIPQGEGLHNGVFLDKQPARWGDTALNTPNTDLFSGGICVRGSGLNAIWTAFVGGQSKLWKRATGWGDSLADDVTRTVGGGYGTLPGNRWQFAKFGDYVFAVNGSDEAQIFKLGTSTNFEDLTSYSGYSGPASLTPKYVTVWGSFVFFADDTSVYWCGVENPLQWEPGFEGADKQDIPDSGGVRGLVSSLQGVIVGTRDNLQLFRFTGDEDVFRRDVANESVGVAAAYSMVQAENTFFFLSRSGFREGLQAMPVGRDKVDRTFTRKLVAAAFALQNYFVQKNFVAWTGNDATYDSNNGGAEWVQIEDPSSQVYDWVGGWWDDSLGLVIWTADPRYYSGAGVDENPSVAALAYSPVYRRWVVSPLGVLAAGGWRSVRGERDDYPVSSYIYYSNGDTEANVGVFQGTSPWSFVMEWHPGAPVMLRRLRLVGQFGGNTKLTKVEIYKNRWDGSMVSSPYETLTPDAAQDEVDEVSIGWHRINRRGLWFRFHFAQADDPTTYTEQIMGLQVDAIPAGGGA